MVIDLSYRGPLQRYWSSIFHIEALCKSNGHRSFISRPSTKVLVIDLSYRGTLQRPSTKVLVINLSYRGPLQRPSAKQWSSIFHIKTLFDGMVIDFHMLSYRGALQKQWSSIFHIKAVSDGMVIDFLNVYIDVVAFILIFPEPPPLFPVWDRHWSFLVATLVFELVTNSSRIRRPWSCIFLISF
ncbi:hypothetical protein DEO72_LG3g706 [Vigna unguiculata]|uniref:Uncharacterized protein n=1 Tax=Vigna unguiculata TaxID=3917 RepID=A0A4D6LCW3_VIGUN|nr:hypothetical protein DEO72_LG3g706 [Vigna unguiculata]